jgi:hypothetical protein
LIFESRGSFATFTHHQAMLAGNDQVTIGLMVWGVMAYGLTRLEPGHSARVAAWSFGAATALMVVGGVYKIARAMAARRGALRQRASRDIPVTITLPVVAASPAARHAVSALPDYCRRLVF